MVPLSIAVAHDVNVRLLLNRLSTFLFYFSFLISGAAPAHGSCHPCGTTRAPMSNSSRQSAGQTADARGCGQTASGCRTASPP